MHLFAIALDLPEIGLARLEMAVGDVADGFRLDPATAWRAESRAGRVRAAGRHHAVAAASPRRYVAHRGESLVCFDGLPVDGDHGFAARDAEQLADRWPQLPDRLEGQFAAARLDLGSETVEILCDTLGLLPTFAASHEGGTLISNSAGLIASTLGLDSLDPLAATSLVGLGWAVERRTLWDGLRALTGGALHRFEPGAHRQISHFTPAMLAREASLRGRRGTRPDHRRLAATLVTLTRAATDGLTPVRCALTAGRDTRVLLALSLQTPGAVSYYTNSSTGDIDVSFARDLAGELGLEHSVEDVGCVAPDASAAAEFALHNDGLSTLHQLADHIDLAAIPPQVGVTMWGGGGEIGRAGSGAVKAVAPNLPLVSRSTRLQRRLLALKNSNEVGLLTAEARARLADYLERFIDLRLAEGWPVAELSEAFYTFERVGCAGAAGPRREAARSDIFTPFSSRAFINYCFSLNPAERLVEAPHYRLLTVLSPRLRDRPFAKPFYPQHPRLAGLLASSRLLRELRSRRLSLPTLRSGAAAPVTFTGRWLEENLELMRAIFSDADPELWTVIDRHRLQRLLSVPARERASYVEPLLRAATVAWYPQLLLRAARTRGRPAR
jgi:asparagine synthase (glutamine-hydrolysing)